MTTYAVRFDFPDSPYKLYAGIADGAYGFALTLKTAELFDSEEAAQRILQNAYGKYARLNGRVITVKAGRAVA